MQTIVVQADALISYSTRSLKNIRDKYKIVLLEFVKWEYFPVHLVKKKVSNIQINVIDLIEKEDLKKS